MLTYVDLSRLGEDLHRSQRGRRAHEGRRKKNLRFRCSSLLQGKLLFCFLWGERGWGGAGRIGANDFDAAKNDPFDFSGYRLGDVNLCV